MLSNLPNVYTMTFQEEQGGFFVGVAAALTTKTNKVAVVNGIAFPSNVNYQFGFMASMNYANAKFGTKAELVELPSFAGTAAVPVEGMGENVGGNYVGSFADEATGKEVGKALIDAGADVILVAAGSSGNGVFTAAKEAGNVFVIGCDVDQYDDGVNGDKNIILTSAMKIMDVNVTRQLEAIYEQGQTESRHQLENHVSRCHLLNLPGKTAGAMGMLPSSTFFFSSIHHIPDAVGILHYKSAAPACKTISCDLRALRFPG